MTGEDGYNGGRRVHSDGGEGRSKKRHFELVEDYETQVNTEINYYNKP